MMRGIVEAQTPQAILVVTGACDLRTRIAETLEGAGYRVASAPDGRCALDCVRREPFALVILDLTLPHNDGFDVCRLIRAEGTQPILALTVPDGDLETVLGLAMGADTHLPKPLAPRVLLAQVAALLRRVALDADARLVSRPPEPGREVLFDDVVLDRVGRRLWKSGREIPLTLKEYELLSFLVRHEGRVLSRQELRAAIWETDHVHDHRTLDVHIRWLRKKIERDPDAPRHISTATGIGYRFERASTGVDARSVCRRLRAVVDPLQGMTSEAIGTELRDAFGTVPDPRSPHGRRHPLPAILALTAAALLAGASSPEAVARWGLAQPAAVVRALGFTRERTPSVSALEDLLRQLDAAAVEAALADWLSARHGAGAGVADQDRRAGRSS